MGFLLLTVLWVEAGNKTQKLLKYFLLVQRAVFSANHTSHFLNAEVLPVGSFCDINSSSKLVLTKLKYLLGSVAPSLGREGRMIAGATWSNDSMSAGC